MTTNYKAGFIYNGFKPDNVTELLQLRNADGSAYTNFSCAKINTNTNDINLGSGSIYGASIIQFGGTADAGQIDFNITKGGQFTFTSDDQIWMNFTTGNKGQILFDSNGSIGCPATGTVSAGAFNLTNGGSIYGGKISTSQVTVFSQGIYANGNIDLTNGLFINNNDYFSSNDNARTAYLNNNGSVGSYSDPDSVWTPNASFSLFSRYRIVCGGEMNVNSDARIKTNISDISSSYALHIIKNIKPKKYTYKDYIKQGSRINYGFIAQEVFEEFNDAVSKIVDYIPNIYCMAEIKNKNNLQFTNFSTNNFSNEYNSIKLKLINDQNVEFIVTVKEIVSDNLLLLNEELENNTYFVYGQEVDDFHILEKNAIFTLTTAAVKQLDLELQETKETVVKQQQQIDSQKQQIDNQKQQIDNQKQQIDSQKQQIDSQKQQIDNQKQQIDHLTADLAALKALIMGRL